MAVRYVRVDPIVNLFAPAVRAFGNIAIVGQTKATAPVIAQPVLFTNPDDAKDAKTGFPGDLGNAIERAFLQTPGPTVVYGVPVANEAPDWAPEGRWAEVHPGYVERFGPEAATIGPPASG